MAQAKVSTKDNQYFFVPHSEKVAITPSWQMRQSQHRYAVTRSSVHNWKAVPLILGIKNDISL
jgi:hypothetical protein